MEVHDLLANQVVLGRQKGNHAKFAALKVVFLGNPELEADHLSIMRKSVYLCKPCCQSWHAF